MTVLFSVRQVRRDEKKYYEDLLQYSKQHLMVGLTEVFIKLFTIVEANSD